MDEVRLAVIGFGGMGRGMVRRAEGLETVACVAAVDPRPEGRRLAEEEHDLKTFESVDELLDAALADAVYVATPNKQHAPLTVQCLEAGLHVFCEKPMAMNAAEAERMVEASRRNDRRLTVNFSYRENGKARAIRALAEGGELGEVYFARTGWIRNRGIPLGSGWFADRELAGGGPLIDLGVHRIDLALWFMGHPEPVSVTGVAYDMLGKRLAAERGQEFSVEDLAAGFVRFEGGAALSIIVAWASNSEWPEDMYTCVYGTRAGAAHRHVGGTYEFEARLWGEVGGGFGETVITRPPGGPSHLEAFADAVLTGAPVPVDPEDALKVQRIIDALYESAATGREVRLAAR
jgi:predicted dehydrogenase